MIRTTVAAAILALSLPLLPASAATDPLLVAHRGVGTTSQNKVGLPENSLPALSWASGQDADFVEMDASVSRDGVIFLMHDSTLSRTTNGTGSVRERDWSYISARWLELPQDLNGNGSPDDTNYHPPSMNAVLDLLKNDTVKITIDMKGDGWTQTRVNQLRDKLKARGMFTSRVNVHSNTRSTVAKAKAAGFPNRGIVVLSADPLPSVATVKSYGQHVMINYSKATRAKVSEYNAAGLKVWLWTMDTTSEYDKATSVGATYSWMVDDLNEAQEYLR